MRVVAEPIRLSSPSVGWTWHPPMKNSSIWQPLSIEPSLFPLSSRELVTFSIFRAFRTPYRMCFTQQQNRHPERSASQIYRITKGLKREVEGPRRCLPTDAVRSFPATNTRETKKVTSSERSRPVPACRGGICGSTNPSWKRRILSSNNWRHRIREILSRSAPHKGIRLKFVASHTSQKKSETRAITVADAVKSQ